MSEPRYIAIVAMASNRVIGRDGQLPWHLPGDLKFFKRTTMGHAILMGRKTWESIGKPLPGRRNIVLSRSLDAVPDSVELIRQPGELEAEGTVYVIGGAVIYEAYLPKCEEILLTYVLEPYEGDTELPRFEDDFEMREVLERTDEFEIRRYVRK